MLRLGAFVTRDAWLVAVRPSSAARKPLEDGLALLARR